MNSNDQKIYIEKLHPMIQDHADKLNWPRNVSPQEVSVRRLDGLTNFSFKVSLPFYPTIMAQVFGDGVLSRLISRQKDNMATKLVGEHKIGTKVLYFTENSRIEEFNHGTMLSKDDIQTKEQKAEIMYYLTQIHKLRPEFCQKKNMLDSSIDGDYPIIKLFNQSKKIKWSSLSEDEKQKLQFIEKNLLEGNGLQKLQKFFQNSNLVFSHNDLHTGNIIRDPNGSLVVIDFEYCGYNIPTYDIACLLFEYLVDYQISSPPFFKYSPEDKVNQEELDYILFYYLFFYNLDKKLSSGEVWKYLNNQNLARQVLLSKLSRDEIKEELNKLRKEIKASLALSHFHWSLWSILMCKADNINFDYLDFGYMRAKEFLTCMQSLE